MQGVLLAAASASEDPLNALLQYGPIGAILVLLIIGWLVPKYVHDRVIEENEKKDQIIERKDQFIAELQESIAKQAIPALIEATGVMKGIPDAENALLKQLILLRDQISDITERAEERSRGQGRGRG